MIAAIMQPTYLPWIGYFDMIDAVDRFVFLDDAQVLKRSWGVRNRILAQGKETFLSVPLIGHTHGQGSAFSDTLVDPTDKWRRKHLATIQHSYGKCAHFSEVFADLEELMAAGHATIGAINQAFISLTAQRIGIKTPLAQSSQLTGVEGRKDARLLSICGAIGADHYCAAPGSAAYIEAENESGVFAASRVMLSYHNYDHPTYPQSGDTFQSHMSIADLLMNCGYAAALEIIRSGRREMLTSAQMKERMG